MKVMVLCRQAGITVQNAGKSAAGPDTPSREKAALLRAFERIEQLDICYVVAPGGYIGRTVAMEIAYAFAKEKDIVSSEQLEELSARALVSRAMGPEELVRHAQK